MDSKERMNLWNYEQECKPLHRPNPKSQISKPKVEHNIGEEKITKNAQFASKSVNYNDILNKSTLRADAKEWFPSSYTQVQSTPQLQQSVQTHIQRIRSENNTPEACSTETSHKIPFEWLPSSYTQVGTTLQLQQSAKNKQQIKYIQTDRK